jgi:carboxylesterase type B
MGKRWRFACVVLVAVHASVAGAQHVVTESGAISGLRENGLDVYKGIPFAAPAGGRLALASPATCHILDWHA